MKLLRDQKKKRNFAENNIARLAREKEEEEEERERARKTGLKSD